jgi:hypothetical protein
VSDLSFVAFGWVQGSAKQPNLVEHHSILRAMKQHGRSAGAVQIHGFSSLEQGKFERRWPRPDSEDAEVAARIRVAVLIRVPFFGTRPAER